MWATPVLPRWWLLATAASLLCLTPTAEPTAEVTTQQGAEMTRTHTPTTPTPWVVARATANRVHANSSSHGSGNSGGSGKPTAAVIAAAVAAAVVCCACAGLAAGILYLHWECSHLCTKKDRRKKKPGPTKRNQPPLVSSKALPAHLPLDELHSSSFIIEFDPMAWDDSAQLSPNNNAARHHTNDSQYDSQTNHQQQLYTETHHSPTATPTLTMSVCKALQTAPRNLPRSSTLPTNTALATAAAADSATVATAAVNAAAARKNIVASSAATPTSAGSTYRSPETPRFIKTRPAQHVNRRLMLESASSSVMAAMALKNADGWDEGSDQETEVIV